MRKVVFALLACLVSTPLFAVTDSCAPLTQLAELYAVRNYMLRHGSYDVDSFIDARLNDLREPLSGGGYRWVRWARPSGDPEYDKHGHKTIAVNGSDSDNFEASGDHAFAVRVAVPQKQSLFGANNAVYVGTVHLRYVVNGHERKRDEAINRWMNPDTSQTIDLGAIADHVDASLDASTHQHDVKNALVEIHILKAAPQDDPNNPNYPAIESLKHVRGSWDRDAIDDEIAHVESSVFSGMPSVPIYSIVRELRRADELLRSNKEDDQKKGERLAKEALRKLLY
jgi:hypothetical protein